MTLHITPCGNLYIADGTYFYALFPDRTLRTAGMLFSPGYPGFLRGLLSVGPNEFVVTTSGGQVSRYRPASSENEVLADGFDQLYGVAMTADDAVVVAELGTGRVLSIRAGRVVNLIGSRTETVLADLQRPQGILVRGRRLYVVDADAKALIAVDLIDRTRRTIATGLPVGAPPGVVPKPLKGMPPFSGPQGPFAGIAAGPDGTIYVSADADGSVLALRHQHSNRRT